MSTSTKLQKQSQSMLICRSYSIPTATRMMALIMITTVAENILSRTSFLRREMRVFHSTMKGIDRTGIVNQCSSVNMYEMNNLLIKSVITSPAAFAQKLRFS